jgi:hypothetical protein
MSKIKINDVNYNIKFSIGFYRDMAGIDKDINIKTLLEKTDSDIEVAFAAIKNGLKWGVRPEERDKLPTDDELMAYDGDIQEVIIQSWKETAPKNLVRLYDKALESLEKKIEDTDFIEQSIEGKKN